jgi:hypothetical protein
MELAGICSDKSCSGGSGPCEYDSALLGQPDCKKLPDIVTKKGRTVKGHWLCTQIQLTGCFCAKAGKSF